MTILKSKLRRIRSISYLNCPDGTVNLTPCIDGSMFPTLVNITAEEHQLVKGSEERMKTLAIKKLGI